MSTLNRRIFLERTQRSALGLAAGVTILSNPRSVRAAPANDRLALAMIGVGGGRGHSLAMGFLDRDDCEISYICDVNRQLHQPRAEAYAARQKGKRPKCVSDFREMLTDASVDAVVIATPPHWHALATILCCRAGKDVYCEKPQSHNCWEGRQAIAAARKYDRIVQIGTQNRSAPYNFAAKQYYANISCRLGGRKLRIDPKTEQILDDPKAMRLFKREYRKPWVVPEEV